MANLQCVELLLPAAHPAAAGVYNSNVLAQPICCSLPVLWITALLVPVLQCTRLGRCFSCCMINQGVCVRLEQSQECCEAVRTSANEEYIEHDIYSIAGRKEDFKCLSDSAHCVRARLARCSSSFWIRKPYVHNMYHTLCTQ